MSPNITANRNGKVMIVKGAKNEKEEKNPLKTSEHFLQHNPWLNPTRYNGGMFPSH